VKAASAANCTATEWENSGMPEFFRRPVRSSCTCLRSVTETLSGHVGPPAAASAEDTITGSTCASVAVHIDAELVKRAGRRTRHSPAERGQSGQSEGEKKICATEHAGHTRLTLCEHVD
jgi:hypothetical protein